MDQDHIDSHSTASAMVIKQESIALLKFVLRRVEYPKSCLLEPCLNIGLHYALAVWSMFVKREKCAKVDPPCSLN